MAAAALQPPFIAANFAYNWQHLPVCPRSTTLLALVEDYRCSGIIALSCKQWDCRFCAPIKIRKLAAQTRDAHPNRLLTLTVDPAKHANPRDAFDDTACKVPELMAKLRRRFGEIEYLRVTEVTKKGWPHYHLLVRSPYLPHEVVKNLWQQLTGAVIVDLRQVHNSFDSCNYLTKYLSKLHNLTWTERHVSTSRHFFQEDTRPKRTTLKFLQPERDERHPSVFLADLFPGSRIVALSQSLYLIDPPQETPVQTPQPADDF